MNKNKTVTNNKKKISVRVIAGCGMLVAVAVVLQYIEISIPIMPSFIKLDFSDLPELIGAFAYGPLFGVIISLLKNLIHMLFSQSGFVGELSNFILGAVFSFTAGIIYKCRKERKFALIAGVCGAAAMAIISVPPPEAFILKRIAEPNEGSTIAKINSSTGSLVSGADMGKKYSNRLSAPDMSTLTYTVLIPKPLPRNKNPTSNSAILMIKVIELAEISNNPLKIMAIPVTPPKEK